MKPKISQNSNRVTPNRGAKCRCGRLKLATFDKYLATTEKRRPSQVSSTSFSCKFITQKNSASSFVCSMFAVMQCIMRVRQRQRVFVDKMLLRRQVYIVGVTALKPGTSSSSKYINKTGSRQLEMTSLHYVSNCDTKHIPRTFQRLCVHFSSTISQSTQT